MLLFFRFALILLQGLFRRRIGPLDAALVRFTALPHDCDLNFHLNGGRYLSFMDISRVEMLARMGAFRRLIRRGWRPIMGGCTIRFRRSVLPFERFSVESRILAWDEKWFYVEQLVRRHDGSVSATGTARMIVKGRDGTIPMSDVLELFGLGGMASPNEVPA
jgi:acyl-CoA thioesterase FadM